VKNSSNSEEQYKLTLAILSGKVSECKETGYMMHELFYLLVTARKISAAVLQCY